VTFNVVKLMFIAWCLMFEWMTLCSFFILFFFLFRVEELYVMSFDHVTLITTVIVGCQCIAMVQNRY